MLSKCANPACSRPFRYLRDGKLFEIDSRDESVLATVGEERKPVRRVEFFWLCGECSAEMTIINDRDRGVVAVPIVEPPRFLRRAAAS